VVLGHPYDGRIDIWSLGAVAAEMYTGYVLFQNDSLATMLARIIGIIGNFPSEVLENGRETSKYFTADNSLVYEKSESGDIVLIYPKKTTLASRLHLVDELPPSSSSTPTSSPRQLSEEALFIDFVAESLLLHPQQRPTATQALKHQWLQGAYDIDFTRIDSVYAAQPAAPEDEEIEGEGEDLEAEDEDVEGEEEDEEDDGEYEDIDDDEELDEDADGEEEDVEVDHAKVYYDSTTSVQGSVYDVSLGKSLTELPSPYRGVSDISTSRDEEESSSLATSPRSTSNRPGHDRDESFLSNLTSPPAAATMQVDDDELAVSIEAISLQEDIVAIKDDDDAADDYDDDSGELE
jgi:serine/threonine protein kinase